MTYMNAKKEWDHYTLTRDSEKSHRSVFLNAGIQKETEVSIPRMSYIGLQNRTGYWSLQEFG